MTKHAMYDFATAAEILGISEHTLRRWTAQKRLRFYKIGGRVRFTDEHLEEFLNRSEVQPTEEGAR